MPGKQTGRAAVGVAKVSPVPLGKKRRFPAVPESVEIDRGSQWLSLTKKTVASRPSRAPQDRHRGHRRAGEASAGVSAAGRSRS